MDGRDMFTNLETDRLVLKCIDANDREFIFEEFQNDFINRYLYDAEPMKDIAEADELIAFYTAAEPRQQNRWVLVEKASGQKLGTCGYHFWKRDKKEVEIGFELMQAHNGQGYMREAVRAILEFARQQMGVETVRAVVSVDNEACIRLLEGLGFVRVGKEETVFRGQVYPHHVAELKI